MYPEDSLLPISALQHLLYCPRQCALIHVEGQWAESRLTAEGRVLHGKVHGGQPETRAGVRVARTVPLRSLRLGLFGVADVVEFHPPPPSADPPSVDAATPVADASSTDAAVEAVAALPEKSQFASPAALPFPVEYKRGRPKRNDCDRVQLCAQALCLEEMLDVRVPAGALFYGRPRRREAVEFDEALRMKTEQTARRLHELLSADRLPDAEPGPKCKNCSLKEICLPDATNARRSATRYLKNAIKRALEEETTE